jgi:predicted TIM-barrel fold metal-dependent hydrolase
MIVDANVHLTEDSKWFATSLTADSRTLLGQMDKAGVDKALLVPFHGFTSNQFVINTTKQHPDRFISACSVNPMTQSTAVLQNELKDLQEKGVKICKLHNRLHKYEPGAAEVYRFLEMNEKLDQPMIISICGIIYDKNINPSLPPVHHFQKLTSSFPDTIFIIVHAAGTSALSLYEAVKDNPNVYLDLSFTISKYKGSSVDLDLKYLIENFDRKLIWGSDFPEFTVKKALTDFHSLASAVSDDKKRNILSTNILRLLN